MTIRWRGVVIFLLGCAATPIVTGVVNTTPYAAVPVEPLLLPDTTGNADAIVVLGAAVIEGCTLNINGVRRVMLAARLYHEHRAPLVLFSGGTSPGMSCAVGEAMSRLARRMGVPADRIRTETTSTTTWENSLHSMPQLKALGARRLLLVTDRLHMLRSEAAFARFGFDIERATVPMHEGYRDNVDMLYHAVRERIAISYYTGRGWIANPFDRPGKTAVHDTTLPVPTPATSPVVNPQGPFVILGASYAGGWAASHLAGVAVVNKGISGQQSFELLGRFEQDVLPAKPRAVILWGFINDIFRTPRGEVDAALTRVRESFEALVARARASGIEPILVTEVTIRQPRSVLSEMRSVVGGWLGRPSYAGYVNGHVLATNAWLRELARREDLLLLDAQPMLSAPDGRRLREYAASDGSHISAAGYEALTRYVTPILEARLRAR